jgi:hypothetical protein
VPAVTRKSVLVSPKTLAELGAKSLGYKDGTVGVEYSRKPRNLCYLYIREQIGVGANATDPKRSTPIDDTAYLVFNINPKSMSIEQGVRVGVQQGRNGYTVSEGGPMEPHFNFEGHFGQVFQSPAKPGGLKIDGNPPKRDGFQAIERLRALVLRYLEDNQQRTLAGQPLLELVWCDPLHGGKGQNSLRWVVTPASIPSLKHEAATTGVISYRMELIGVYDDQRPRSLPTKAVNYTTIAGPKVESSGQVVNTNTDTSAFANGFSIAPAAARNFVAAPELPSTPLGDAANQPGATAYINDQVAVNPAVEYDPRPRVTENQRLKKSHFFDTPFASTIARVMLEEEYAKVGIDTNTPGYASNMQNFGYALLHYAWAHPKDGYSQRQEYYDDESHTAINNLSQEGEVFAVSRKVPAPNAQVVNGIVIGGNVVRKLVRPPVPKANYVTNPPVTEKMIAMYKFLRADVELLRTKLVRPNLKKKAEPWTKTPLAGLIGGI